MNPTGMILVFCLFFAVGAAADDTESYCTFPREVGNSAFDMWVNNEHICQHAGIEPNCLDACVLDRYGAMGYDDNVIPEEYAKIVMPNDKYENFRELVAANTQRCLGAASHGDDVCKKATKVIDCEWRAYTQECSEYMDSAMD